MIDVIGQAPWLSTSLNWVTNQPTLLTFYAVSKLNCDDFEDFPVPMLISESPEKALLRTGIS